jgi:hypothetical protein
MSEVHRHEGGDFKAGDKVLIGDSPTDHLAVVTCTHAVAGKRVHGLDYKSVGGWVGWAEVKICRRVSDEEWVALILKGGKGA